MKILFNKSVLACAFAILFAVTGSSAFAAVQGAQCLSLERAAKKCEAVHGKKFSSHQVQQCKSTKRSFSVRCESKTICGQPAAVKCAADEVCAAVLPKAQSYESVASLKQANATFLYYGVCLDQAAAAF